MADNHSGHGTYVEDEQVIASVTGTIERVNKLVSVKALKSRYISSLDIRKAKQAGTSPKLATSSLAVSQK